MKTISPLIIICIFTVGYASPGSFGDIAIKTGVAIPIGERGESHGPGPNLEVWGLINLSNPNIKILIGHEYAIVPGKTEQFDRNYPHETWHYEYKYQTAYLTSLFIGPQILRKDKVFICPAVCLNHDGFDTRFGINLMTGLMTPVSRINKVMTIDFKISMMNLIGNEENEPLIVIVKIGAGVIL
ncbi:hypothetical protein ACFL4K_01135 [Candidatus Neomarinimicrobiota bacterium]